MEDVIEHAKIVDEGPLRATAEVHVIMKGNPFAAWIMICFYAANLTDTSFSKWFHLWLKKNKNKKKTSNLL